MEMFSAFLLWSAAMFGIGYAASSSLENTDQVNTITKTGELVLRNTVYACHPTHALVNGQRITLEVK